MAGWKSEVKVYEGEDLTIAPDPVTPARYCAV